MTNPDLGQHVISATFICDACGKAAATVHYMPPHHKDPRLEGSDDPGRDMTLDLPGISIEGGPEEMTIGLAGDWPPAAIAALRSRDVVALFAVNSEFAPFWCPDCRKIYCADHWLRNPIWDGEFFDYTEGTCPEGHRRILSD